MDDPYRRIGDELIFRYPINYHHHYFEKEIQHYINQEAGKSALTKLTMFEGTNSIQTNYRADNRALLVKASTTESPCLIV